MRKLLLLSLAAGLVLVAAPAAQATEYEKNCHTYYGGNAGNKAAKVCVTVVNTGSEPWWARMEISDVAGYGDPYTINTQVSFFSKNGNTEWCHGYIAHCNQNPTGDAYAYKQGWNGATVHLNTDHYLNSEHYCTIQSVGAIGFLWNSGDTVFDNNSIDSYDRNVLPNCTTT